MLIWALSGCAGAVVAVCAVEISRWRALNQAIDRELERMTHDR